MINKSLYGLLTACVIIVNFNTTYASNSNQLCEDEANAFIKNKQSSNQSTNQDMLAMKKEIVKTFIFDGLLKQLTNIEVEFAFDKKINKHEPVESIANAIILSRANNDGFPITRQLLEMTYDYIVDVAKYDPIEAKKLI